MMQYDVVSKVLMDHAARPILEKILKIPIKSVRTIRQLPRETANLRRVDTLLLVRKKRQKQGELLLIETLTAWNEKKINKLAEYWLQIDEKYERREVIPYLVLLTPHGKAVNFIRYKRLTFEFELVKMWEFEAREYLESDPELLSYVPLMKGGLEMLARAENRIYAEVKETEKRADLLASLAIFAGLKDVGLAKMFIDRRRDIMIESPVYEIIKQEGRDEGIREGIEKGKLEGIEQGKLETARNMMAEGMELKLVKKITGLTEQQLRDGGILAP